MGKKSGKEQYLDAKYVTENTHQFDHRDVAKAREFCDGFEAGQLETLVIYPTWKTPEEFGIYEIFEDGSFQFLHNILFWALIPTKTANEIHLCGVDESGLYGWSFEIDDRYDTGWSLEDVEFCMRYDKKGK